MQAGHGGSWQVMAGHGGPCAAEKLLSTNGLTFAPLMSLDELVTCTPIMGDPLKFITFR